MSAGRGLKGVPSLCAVAASSGTPNVLCEFYNMMLII